MERTQRDVVWHIFQTVPEQRSPAREACKMLSHARPAARPSTSQQMPEEGLSVACSVHLKKLKAHESPSLSVELEW